MPFDVRGYEVILRDSFRSARGLAELLDGRELAGHRCVVLQPPDLHVLPYAFAPVGRATLAAGQWVAQLKRGATLVGGSRAGGSFSG